MHASTLVVWHVSCNIADPIAVGSTYNTVLSTLEEDAELVNPFPGISCFVFFEGDVLHRRKSRNYHGVLLKAVKETLNAGNKIVMRISPKGDILQCFTVWKEMQQLHTHPEIFTNADHSCKQLAQLLNLLPKKTTTVKKLVHFELGDHADEEIQKVSATRKKARPIEEWYDDCGDDCSQLELPELTGYAACFSDSEPEPEQQTQNHMFDNLFFCSHFWGSDCSDNHEHECFSKSFTTIKRWPTKDTVDYMELFGGAGGITRVAIRRHLKGGRNFDLTAGVNLHEQREIDALMRYIQEYKPFAVVMGPPCTAFSSWSSYNSVHNWEAWNNSMKEGLPLARLAARVAQMQIDGNRFFICENPWGSKLWELDVWVKILAQHTVHYVYADQCAYGLKSIEGSPTKKPTCFVANHPTLLKYLQRVCTANHQHVQLQGSRFRPRNQSNKVRTNMASSTM